MAKQAQKQTAHPPWPPTGSTRRQPRVDKEKDAGIVATPSALSSSQSQDKNLKEVVARFVKVCPCGSMQAESSMQWDIMALKEASFLAEVNVFREAAISAKAELDEAKQELARFESSIAFLNKALTEAENMRDAALVESERLMWALDTETFRSLRRRAERESLREDRALLRDEKRLLRGTMRSLEARFVEGYFYAAYQVTKALPPPYNLKVAFGWGWKQIEDQAAKLSSVATRQDGTNYVKEDQLNQDKRGDNVGMEDEDIAGELERNLEQVSDTHMIDLEPLPSGPSNEKLEQFMWGVLFTGTVLVGYCSLLELFMWGTVHGWNYSCDGTVYDSTVYWIQDFGL
ncbi:hypothetical protein LWI29_006386 [Acer saccharum]|uniref:Uncharacterized protein n=1 Tax=Acer saccharum TaxID=4024 RepID=A0AA39SRS9_ACESA|nr:hypothetical protein LWI29_006386 [Acer saccharum]